MPPAADEEEAFPRRKLSAQTANEVLEYKKRSKRPQAFNKGLGGGGTKAPDDDDEGEAPNKRTKFADVDVSAGSIPGMDVESVEHLRITQFTEGLLMVGAVHNVTDQDLTLDLPFHTMGFVNRSEAFEPDSASGPLPSLTEIYKPGQLVMAVVSSILTGAKSQLRVEMSMRPALMNAGLNEESVTKGMWLPAVVQDEQEHVFRLAFGIKNLQGVLKKSEAKKLPFLLVPGLIINVGVLSAPTKGTVMCSASQVGKIGQETELSVETLKAGFLVDATVNKIFSRDEETGKKKKGNIGSGDGGLMMKVCGAVVARVHWHHHQKLRDEGGEMRVWERREQVEARIIAVVPSMPPVIHLSMLPHLVNWKSCEKEVTRHAAIGERLPIKVVDKVEKFSVRVLCNPGVEGVLPGYVPAKRLADKGVDVVAPDVGEQLEARVIAYDYLESRLVLTRRPYDLLPETLVSSAELLPGQLVVGEVSSVTEYGMFVRLSEYITGLVTNRHVADVPLAAVPPRFKVGTRVKCRVLFVKKNGNFELTAKKTLVKDDFQLCKFEEARKDMIVTGTVKRVGEHGHVVGFYGDLTGLIPSEDLQEGEAAPTVGMLAQVKVTKLNRRKQTLKLSMDTTNGKTPRELLDSHFIDDSAFPPGVSVAITGLVEARESGIVVSIRSTKDKTAESKGYIPSAHLADELSLGESWFQEIKAGKDVPLPTMGVVLSTETDKESAPDDSGPYMMLSAKPLLLLAAEEEDFVTSLNKLKEGGHYSGYVCKIFDFGATVSVGLWNDTGLLPRSFVCGPEEKVEDVLKVGETLRVQVGRINLDEAKFQVDPRGNSADKPVLRREAEALRRMFVDRKAHQARDPTKKPPAAWKTLTPGAVVEGKVGDVDEAGTATLTLKGYKGIKAVVAKENVPHGTTLEPEQAVRCAVLDFDSETGLVDVSLQAELVDAAGKSAPSNNKRRKKAAAAGAEEGDAAEKADDLEEGQEFKAFLALRKPGYAVLWTKEPPNILYTPPFGSAGPKGRRWRKPVPVIYHAREGDRLLAYCRPAGKDQAMKASVPKVTDAKVGSTISVSVNKVGATMIHGIAPVSILGCLHATQCVEVPPKEEMKLGAYLGNPLEALQLNGVLTGRVISLVEKKIKDKEVLQVELTRRQSVMDLPEDAEIGGAVVPRWDTLEVGQMVMGVIAEVKEAHMFFEVGKNIRGILPVTLASGDRKVRKNPAEHFKPGQVYIASVLSVDKEKQKVAFTLREKPPKQADVKKDDIVQAKFTKLATVAGKGTAAWFRLPNNKTAYAHITELFDYWDPFPQKKLVPKKTYEAKVLREKVILHPDNPKAQENAEITLRASAVFGKKVGQSERRPEKVEDLQVNQMVSGYVVGAGPKGVFVALSPSVTGWIGILSMREKVDDPNKIAEIHKIGELIQDAKVYKVIPEKQKLMLTLQDFWSVTKDSQIGLEQLSVGDNVSCFVHAVEKYGIKIRVDNSQVKGLIHRTEVSDNNSVTLDSFKRGMKIKRAKILKIDTETGKVNLGLKASYFEGEEPAEEDEEDDDEMDDDAEPEPAPAVAEQEPVATAEAATEGQEAALPAKGKKRKASAVAVAIEGAPAKAGAAGEAAPWDLAAAATLTGIDNKSDAFDWPDFKVAGNDASEDEDEEDVGEVVEEGKDKKLNKRQRKEKRLEQAKELQQKEEEQAEGAWAQNPTSVEDFERLLLSQGNTSIVWIRYMAFHLKLSDLERARQVAERAVKHVGFSDAKERFNTWVAFMNLECTFGTEATADAVFKRASSHNPAKQVHLQLARIHERNKKPLLAVKVFESAAKKFGHSKKVWLAFLAFLYQQGDLDGGRKTLPKALAALPKRKHPLVVSKAALLEYSYGTSERGRSVFEGLLDSYPKRTDLWSAYIDAHIRANTPPKVAEPGLKAVRSLLEKCCTMRLKAVKMRFFFKRWLDFEKRWGDAESQESVRARARDFVESQGS